MKFQIYFEYWCNKYMLHESSFISTQYFVLYLDDYLMYYLTNLLFFGIPLLYYYINLRSAIIFWLSSGDIYFSLAISLTCSFVTVSELFCSEVFKIFIILPAILIPIKSPVTSAVFLISLFKAVLSASVADCLA